MLMQLWLLRQGVFTSKAKNEDSDADEDNINRYSCIFRWSVRLQSFMSIQKTDQDYDHRGLMSSKL